MCVLLITWLLRGVGRWARKPVNHTSWVAVVTPTDRPKSVRNCCLIELFCDVVCAVVLPFWHFCWCRGFCHRTWSDLLLFALKQLNICQRVVQRSKVQAWKAMGRWFDSHWRQIHFEFFSHFPFLTARRCQCKWIQAWHTSRGIGV